MIMNRKRGTDALRTLSRQALVQSAALLLAAGSFWAHLAFGSYFYLSALLPLWLIIHGLSIWSQGQKKRSWVFEIAIFVALNIYLYFSHYLFLPTVLPVMQLCFLSTAIALFGLAHQEQKITRMYLYWAMAWSSQLLWISSSTALHKLFNLSDYIITLAINGVFLLLFNSILSLTIKRFNQISKALAGRKEFDDHRIHQSRLSTLGELTASVGHELGTPLTAIKGYTDQIKNELNNENPSISLIENAQQRLEHNVERMMNLTKALKNYSRKRSSEHSKVSVLEVFKDAESLLAPSFQIAKVKLRFIKPEEDCIMDGVFVQLSQLIVNLLQNALDAALVSQNKEVVFGYRQKDRNYVHFWVEDSGEGVPEEARSKIFDSFYTTKELGKGTGLGLSISKKIVERHEGIISVDSPVVNGVVLGARFNVELPLVVGDKSAAKKAA